MTHALPTLGHWMAFYTDRNGFWRVARDARGHPIHCETKALAKSVAACRRHRLNPFQTERTTP